MTNNQKKRKQQQRRHHCTNGKAQTPVMTNQEGEKKMSFLEKIKEKAKKVVRWFKKDKTQVFTGIAVSVVPSVCALGLAFFMANKAVGYANELNVYKYHVGVMAKFLSENQDVVDRFSAWVNEAK